jgi:hypothetical protein
VFQELQESTHETESGRPKLQGQFYDSFTAFFFADFQFDCITAAKLACFADHRAGRRITRSKHHGDSCDRCFPQLSKL